MVVKNTKFYILGVLILLSLIVIILYFVNYIPNRKIIMDETSNNFISSKALTMMYETEYDSGEYQASSDSNWPTDGYTFNDSLSGCEKGSKVYWNAETNRVIMEANTSDRCFIYFDKDPITLTSYIMNTVFTGTDGENGLYLHDGSGTYNNADQEAGDNSYRYSGANPNNYVCFGSDEAICPEDNLYRIIGVFNNNNNYSVKLIKNTSIGEYNWLTDSTGTGSNWGSSIVNGVLNGNYYNSLNIAYQELIENASWNVGFVPNNYSIAAKSMFEYEIGQYFNGAIYTQKVGLMYASDYLYANVPTSWLSVEQTTKTNWMASVNEWTITAIDDDAEMMGMPGTVLVLYASHYRNGNISYDYVDHSGSTHNIRPTFYLKNTVILTGGTGTESDPYRIA